MINLNTNITFPNINRWEVLDFNVNRGAVTIRFWSPNNTLPAPRWLDVTIQLSDGANQSSGPALNPFPQQWNDRIMVVSGVGAAGSLTAAQTAYRGTANHNAGKRAVEDRGLVDGWMNSTFAGT